MNGKIFFTDGSVEPASVILTSDGPLFYTKSGLYTHEEHIDSVDGWQFKTSRFYRFDAERDTWIAIDNIDRYEYYTKPI